MVGVHRRQRLGRHLRRRFERQREAERGAHARAGARPRCGRRAARRWRGRSRARGRRRRARRGGISRTGARGRPPAGRGRSPRPTPRARRRGRCARRRTSVRGGVWRAAFSSRLASACSISAASTRTSGRSPGRSTITRWSARRWRRRRSTEAGDLADASPSRARADRRRSPGASSAAPWRRARTCRATAGRCSARARARSSGARRSPRSARLEEAPGDHRERRAQVVRDRGEQRVADALGLGLDRELGLRLRAARARVSVSPETISADREHHGEGQQVLRVVDVEGAARRHEEEVERRDAEDRGGDHRAAPAAQRDQHHARAGTPSRC